MKCWNFKCPKDFIDLVQSKICGSVVQNNAKYRIRQVLNLNETVPKVRVYMSHVCHPGCFY